MTLNLPQPTAQFDTLNEAQTRRMISQAVNAITSAPGFKVLSYAPRMVFVQDYGAKGDGVADDTVSIQAAINSGALAVCVPPGSYRASSLTMPASSFFRLYGLGAASKIVQIASAVPLIKWSTAAMVYSEQTIEGLALDGTAGGGHLIDTSGAGGLTIRNIYVNNVPAAFSAIYVNGAGGAYTHDIRIGGLQIYSATAGHSGVRFGPLAADSSLTNFIMNGEFIVSYGAFLDSGSVAVTITNSHPYNCAINVVKGLGSMLGSQFVGNTFDNASGGDLVTLGAASAVTFTGNYFEAVNSGHSALSLVGSNGVALVNNSFLANAGAVSAVVESGGANYTSVSGGVIPVSTNFSSLFNLSGAQSWARGIAGYNPLGLQYAFSGTTVSTQAQNTTVYLGSNGAQASSINTAYVVPSAGTLTTINLAVDTTPAAGQTYTFTAYNGAAIVGSPLVVSNTGFGGLMTLNSSVAVGDQISIKSVFSATSGAANIRYSVSFVG